MVSSDNNSTKNKLQPMANDDRSRKSKTQSELNKSQHHIAFTRYVHKIRLFEWPNEFKQQYQNDMSG